jgi:hypothetical protein
VSYWLQTSLGKTGGAGVVGEKPDRPMTFDFLKGEPMFQFFLFCSNTGCRPVPAYFEMMPLGLIDTAEFNPG